MKERGSPAIHICSKFGLRNYLMTTFKRVYSQTLITIKHFLTTETSYTVRNLKSFSAQKSSSS